MKGADIDAVAGWDIRTSASNTIVAVIDSGVRYTHEDLAQNMWVNPGEIPNNGIDDDGDGYIDDVHGINAITGSGDPRDDLGHGTHVAGILGAVGNNGIGVVGVAWNVQIMACKFIGKNGSGYDSDAIECIDYALSKGASIFNCSWGGPAYSRALLDALKHVQQKGILVAAAAGNDNVDSDYLAHYPSGFDLDNIISVSATDISDKAVYWTTYGQATVDLGAPGDYIYSTWYTSDSAYQVLSGTSMAAPYVSGVLALIKEQFPRDSYLQVRNRLLSSAERLPDLTGKCSSGGRLNLAKALQSVHTRPPNDDFSMALPIANKTSENSSVFTFRASGSNQEASLEKSESLTSPQGSGKTLWWSWTPPASGHFSFSTAGSNFHTIVTIYTGQSLAELSRVAVSSANPNEELTSTVSFDAVQGTTYMIAIDGLNGESGNFWLGMAPRNDNFSNRTNIATPITDVTSPVAWFYGGNSLNSSKEEGEPNHAGNAGGGSLWWHWESFALTGILEISTEGSALDTLLAAYTGNDVRGLIPLVSNDDDGGEEGSSHISFDVQHPFDYSIAVDGKNGQKGNILLYVLWIPAPQNDSLATATLAPGNVDGSYLTTLRGTNIAASKELGEPNHAGNPGHRSVWWNWYCQASRRVTITTEGSDFNTLLAVYTGSSVSNLTLIAANDDDPLGGKTSRVTFDAIAGQTYQIVVDGFNGESGKIVLNLPAWNDYFQSPFTITGTSLGTLLPGYASNITASKDAGEPNHAGNPGGKSVWWKWIAPFSCTMTLSTAGSSFNTLLAVYTGTLPNLNLITSNDDDPLGGKTSWVRFQASAGSEYLIAVDGYNGESGSIMLYGSYGVHNRNLGTFGTDRNSVAKAINNRNQVVGWSFNEENDLDPGADKKAMVWSATEGMQLLGTLGGKQSVAQDINDHGQIVGWSNVYSGDPTKHAFYWENGNMRDLGALPGGDQSQALAINSSGQIAGIGTNAKGYSVACFWNQGGIQEIGTLGGNQSQAMAINASAQVVGWAETKEGTEHAFLWEGGSLKDLGILPGGNRSQAFGINDRGQIVGKATTSGDKVWHAFLWQDGYMLDLGVLDGLESAARSINNSGVIIGDLSMTLVMAGFIWHDGIMQRLRDTPRYASCEPELYYGFDINDNGLAVGAGQGKEFCYGEFATLTYPPGLIDPPTVTILTPTEGSQFWARDLGRDPVEVIETADAHSKSSEVMRVEYTSLGPDNPPPTKPPYRQDALLSGGSFRLVAKAVDCNGGIGFSKPVNFDVSPLNYPWINRWIGDSAGYNHNGYDNGEGGLVISTLPGNLGGKQDQAQFSFQYLKGNGQILAYISRASYKAGVMIREDLSGGSPFALMGWSNESGILFEFRSERDSESRKKAVAQNSFNTWVKLVRSGSTLRGYNSTDAIHWNLIGEATIDFPETILVGVGADYNGVFEKIVVSQLDQPQLTSPLNGSAYAAPANLQISASMEDDAIQKMEFLVDGNLVGEAITRPWQITWNSPNPGNHRLLARAVKGSGETVLSNFAEVTITNPPGIQSRWLIPSIAIVGGANNTFWTTTLNLTNQGYADATVTFTFLGNNSDGTTGPAKSISVGAGKTITFVDVLQSVFGISSGFGGLLIESTTPTLNILAQTSTPGGGGTYGQSVPAFSSSDWISYGETRSISGVYQNQAFRSNLILANASKFACGVEVTLVSKEGFIRLNKSYTLPPLGMTQVRNVIEDLGTTEDIAGAQLILRPTTAGGAIAGYVALIDNGTGDPRTLLPQVHSNWLLLPSSARVSGLANTYWTTDLFIANTANMASSLKLKFFGNNQDGRSGLEKELMFNPRESMVLRDVLASVYGLDQSYGAIRLVSESPGFTMLGQTSTPGTGGTYGQSVPAATQADLISWFRPRSITGVAQNNDFRTNLILTNATESDLVVKVTLFNQQGTLLHSDFFIVPSGNDSNHRGAKPVWLCELDRCPAESFNFNSKWFLRRLRQRHRQPHG
ncbi:MAG: S8 family serine peptidase [Terriglobia bacterium]